MPPVSNFTDVVLSNSQAETRVRKDKAFPLFSIEIHTICLIHNYPDSPLRSKPLFLTRYNCCLKLLFIHAATPWRHSLQFSSVIKKMLCAGNLVIISMYFCAVYLNFDSQSITLQNMKFKYLLFSTIILYICQVSNLKFCIIYFKKLCQT